jgi:hypothetical protein
VCAVRDVQWERRGAEAEETQQTLAKPMRSPCEAHAKPMRRLCEDYAKPMRRLCEDYAKTMRRLCEVLANSTLSTPDPCAVTTLLASLEVAGSAGIMEVAHGRKEGADANVPAWMINRAQQSIAGKSLPDEPLSRPTALSPTMNLPKRTAQLD